MTKTPYQLWKEDQERKQKNPIKVPRNLTPYKPGDKKKSSLEGTSLKWESNNLKHISGHGRAYNDRFIGTMNDMGVSDPKEIEGFRNWLDYKENTQERREKEDNDFKHIFDKMKNFEPQRFNAPSTPDNRGASSNLVSQTKIKKDEGLKDKLLGFLKGDKSFSLSGFKDKQEGDSQSSYNAIGKVREGENPTGFDRSLNRAANQFGLGIPEQIAKKTGDQRTLDKYYSQREFGEGGGTDLLSDMAGMLGPGGLIVKGLRGTKLGANTAEKGFKKVMQLGKEGAVAGGALAAGQVGVKEAINPQEQNWRDNTKQIGLETALGAVADTALYGVGKGIQKGVQSEGLQNLVNRLGNFKNQQAPTVNQPTQPLQSTVEKLQPPKQPNILEQLQLNSKKQVSPTLEKPRYENISAGIDENVPLQRIDERLIPKDPNYKFNNPKEIVKQKINTTGKREKSKMSFDKIMTAVVDDLRPLDKATRDLGGKTLKGAENPYTQARLARGVAGKAETFLKGGIYNENGQKVGSSLQEIIKPIENNLDDFLAYTASMRTLDYDDKGLVAGIRPKGEEAFTDRQLAEATIQQLDAENPGFKQTHEQLVNYNKALMNELVDAGVLSRESVEDIQAENPNYVPFFRVQDKKVRGFEPLSNPKKQFANLGEAVKKRTGSEKEIINPVESMVKNTYLMLNMAERNKVGRSLFNLVENAGENTWGRVLGKKQGLTLDELTNTLDDANAQLNDGKADSVDNLFKGEGNKVYVYDNGNKVELELQEDLYKAMLSLDTQKQNFFIKLLSVPTRTLRAGAVLSPDFGPVNIIRDQFSAFVNSKYGFLPFVDMFSGLSNVLKKDDVYWQWKNNGGANSVLSSLDRDYLQKDLRKLIKQPLGQRVKDRLKSPIDTLITPLRAVSEATEEATRLGEFKKGLKKGATPQEAAFASRDLIDFNRAGNLGRQYNQVTAFFNAAVQSIDKAARTFKENPVGATAKATISITLPSIVAYALNHDEEWYKEIPQKERDLYWHFKAGENIVKVPKPFELGVLFGTTAERTMEFMKTNDPEAFKGYVDTVKDSFTPPWLPTALTPWIEVYANKSTYFDSPIVPRREEGLLPEDQYGPYQSEISKVAGNLTKQSPRNIEHVFKGYTGGLGKYGLQISDMAAKAAGVERTEMPDRGLGDLPIVNRFVVKNLEGNNQSVDDFYTLMDKLRREKQSAKKKEEDYKKENLYKLVNKLSRDISEQQAEKREVLANTNLNGNQKANRIKDIDKLITKLAKQAVDFSK
jgi:hypothetical protein